MCTDLEPVRATVVDAVRWMQMRAFQHQMLQQQQAFASAPASDSVSQQTCADEIQPATPPKTTQPASPPTPTSTSSSGRSTAVKVVVRVLPRDAPLQPQTGHEENMVWPEGPSSLQVVTDVRQPPKCIHFDSVLGPDSSQDEVFQVVGKPLVGSVLRGCNATCLVYGTSGSGKTHTMLGTEPWGQDVSGGASGGHPQPPERSQGLVPRVLEHLFQAMSSREARRGVQYTCRMSYLEIYSEQLRDLLNPEAGGHHDISHSPRGTHVAGLREELVLNAKEALALAQTGAANRKLASTARNSSSNLSHCVMRVTVECREELESRLSRVTSVQLLLVDLGSGEGAHSQPSGRAPAATADAMQGIDALKQVIRQVGHAQQAGSRGNAQPPFRDSKLTYLLQDAFGGNSDTVLVAHVASGQASMNDTLRTLNLAQRSTLVKNCVHPNAYTTGELHALEAEVEQLRSRVYGSSGDTTGQLRELSDMKRQARDVADTLRTTMSRLEEEISRSNRLEDALRRANIDLNNRGRTIASLQQQLASASRQLPPPPPSRAAHVGGSSGPTGPQYLDQNSSFNSVHSAFTLGGTSAATQPQSHNTNGALSRSNSYSSATAARRQLPHAGPHEPSASASASRASNRSQLARSVSGRSTGSVSSRTPQKAEPQSAQQVETAAAQAAAEAAAIVAAAERVLSGAGDDRQASNTEELLAHLPPHALAASPGETPTTAAAHAHAVAMASATVFSGGQRPAVPMPTSEAAAAAAKAADKAADTVAQFHVATRSDSSSRSKHGQQLHRSSSSRSDRHAHDTRQQAAAAQTHSEVPRSQSQQVTGTVPPGGNLPAYNPATLNQQQAHQQAMVPAAHNAYLGRTVQPVAPYGYSVAQLSPLPPVGVVSDSSFSDMTDSISAWASKANNSSRHTFRNPPAPAAASPLVGPHTLAPQPGTSDSGTRPPVSVGPLMGAAQPHSGADEEPPSTPRSQEMQGAGYMFSQDQHSAQEHPSGPATRMSGMMPRPQSDDLSRRGGGEGSRGKDGDMSGSGSGAERSLQAASYSNSSDTHSGPALRRPPSRSPLPRSRSHSRTHAHLQLRSDSTGSHNDAPRHRWRSADSQRAEEGDAGLPDIDNGALGASESLSDSAHAPSSCDSQMSPAAGDDSSMAGDTGGAAWWIAPDPQHAAAAVQPPAGTQNNPAEEHSVHSAGRHSGKDTKVTASQPAAASIAPISYHADEAALAEAAAKAAGIEPLGGGGMSSDMEREEGGGQSRGTPFEGARSQMGGLSFAGYAVDDSVSLEASSGLEDSSKFVDSAVQADMHMNARLMQEHLYILGEVGTQSAEKAMQRRQVLLAQQQQWLQGDPGFKGAGVDVLALQLDDADMLSDVQDTSGLVRELYTLQEECTADFSDVSKVLVGRGDSWTPRHLRRSPRHSLHMAGLSPRAALSSPRLAAKLTPDTTDTSHDRSQQQPAASSYFNASPAHSPAHGAMQWAPFEAPPHLTDRAHDSPSLHARHASLPQPLDVAPQTAAISMHHMVRGGSLPALEESEGVGGLPEIHSAPPRARTPRANHSDPAGTQAAVSRGASPGAASLPTTAQSSRRSSYSDLERATGGLSGLTQSHSQGHITGAGTAPACKQGPDFWLGDECPGNAAEACAPSVGRLPARAAADRNHPLASRDTEPAAAHACQDLADSPPAPEQREPAAQHSAIGADAAAPLKAGPSAPPRQLLGPQRSELAARSGRAAGPPQGSALQHASKLPAAPGTSWLPAGWVPLQAKDHQPTEGRAFSGVPNGAGQGAAAESQQRDLLSVRGDTIGASGRPQQAGKMGKEPSGAATQGASLRGRSTARDASTSEGAAKDSGTPARSLRGEPQRSARVSTGALSSNRSASGDPRGLQRGAQAAAGRVSADGAAAVAPRSSASARARRVKTTELLFLR